MMDDQQTGAPAAPAGDPENTAAQGDPASSPAPVTPAAPAAAPADDAAAKAERDRRAREGRERAAERQRIQQLEQQLAQQQTQFNTFLAQQAASEQQRARQYFESIEDPGERALAELRYMQQQRPAGVQPQPARVVQPVAAVPQVDDMDATYRRAQAILDEINEDTGANLTLETPGLDMREEAPFRRSALRLAAQQVKAPGTVPPTAATAATGDDSVPKKTEEAAGAPDVAAITRQVTEQVRRDLGISSPAGPAATGQRARAGVPTQEDLKKTTERYDSRKGPRQGIAALREQRAALEKAVNG